jgi:hypothetical protein
MIKVRITMILYLNAINVPCSAMQCKTNYPCKPKRGYLDPIP